MCPVCVEKINDLLPHAGQHEPVECFFALPTAWAEPTCTQPTNHHHHARGRLLCPRPDSPNRKEIDCLRAEQGRWGLGQPARWRAARIRACFRIFEGCSLACVCVAILRVVVDGGWTPPCAKRAGGRRMHSPNAKCCPPGTGDLATGRLGQNLVAWG